MNKAELVALVRMYSDNPPGFTDEQLAHWLTEQCGLARRDDGLITDEQLRRIARDVARRMVKVHAGP